MSEKPPSEAPKRAQRSRERGPDKAPRAKRDFKAEALKHDAADVKPNSPWKAEALELGAGYLVRLLWLASQGVGFIIGGKIAPLTDEEANQGAREALPIVRRFPALAMGLMLAGLPLWLVRTILAKFTWRPRPPAKQKPPSTTTEKPQEAASGAAEETASQGATVHPIKSGA